MMRLSFLFLFFVTSFNAHANLENNKWIFHYRNEKISFKPSTASPRGNPLIYLDQIVQKFKLTMVFDPQTFKITLSNPRNKKKISFFTHSKKVHGDYWESNLSRKIGFDGARAMVPIDFGDRALRPLLTGVESSRARISTVPKKVEVVIDPGHGGNDFGAAIRVNDHFVFEKDLNLTLAKSLAKSLNSRGVSTVLTRETDSFLTLPERTRFANGQKAKLFLSIHFNMDPSKQSKASGYELFVLSLSSDDAKGRAVTAAENQIIPEDLEEGFERALSDLRAEANLEASISVAKRVNQALSTIISGTQRKIQMGPFYVLYGAEMPALLIEAGYLSNRHDLKFFMDEAKRKLFSDRLATSIHSTLINSPRAR